MLENNTETTVETSTESEAPSWYYQTPNEETQSAGVGGTGDAPDWFMVDKYKSIEEQAKGYKELSSRFGGFEGKPDEYAMPDGIDADSLDGGMIDIVKEIGVENNMSQNMFNDLVTKVNEYQQGQMETNKQQAMENLGPDAEQRISKVNNWLNTNAPKEMIDIIAPMGTSAEAIQALEFFIDKSKGTQVAGNEASAPVSMSESEFADMLMAKDSGGNLKISTDAAYKAKIDKLTQNFNRQ